MSQNYNWQLPASYFAFFLPAGVLLSYLPVFLSQKGLEPAEVGVIFSSVFAVKMFMGPMLAWWADIGRRQLFLLLVAASLSIASAVALSTATSYLILLWSVICISVCRNYFQSLIEAIATHVKSAGQTPRYGRMRAIGSISVCLGVVLFGGLWSAGTGYQQIALPLMIFVSGFILVWCTLSTGATRALSIDTETIHPVLGRDWLRGQKMAIALLVLGSMLMIGANGVFYSTGTLLLQQQGFEPSQIALMWLFAFSVEAVGFAAYERLRSILGSGKFFGFVGCLALLRWAIFATSTDSAWLLFAFGLHVASFSWTHAFFANWVSESTPSGFGTTGQALYTAFAQGIGMAVSAYIASKLLPSFGAQVFWIAAAMTLFGFFIASVRMLLVRPRKTLTTVP